MQTPYSAPKKPSRSGDEPWDGEGHVVAWPVPSPREEGRGDRCHPVPINGAGPLCHGARPHVTVPPVLRTPGVPFRDVGDRGLLFKSNKIHNHVSGKIAAWAQGVARPEMQLGAGGRSLPCVPKHGSLPAAPRGGAGGAPGWARGRRAAGMSPEHRPAPSRGALHLRRGSGRDGRDHP